jgi:hypothetical protein
MLDSEMLQAFREESAGILSELKSVLETLEAPSTDFPAQSLQDFSQKIDRIMGAAKTFSLEAPEHQGLRNIGTLAELCKHIGYKAAEQKQPKLLPIFVAFWSDVIAVTEDLLASLEDEAKAARLTRDFAPVLVRRLEWLKNKVTPAAGSQGGAASAQSQIDELVASLLK